MRIPRFAVFMAGGLMLCSCQKPSSQVVSGQTSDNAAVQAPSLIPPEPLIPVAIPVVFEPSGGGSQGALKPARTGNDDRAHCEFDENLNSAINQEGPVISGSNVGQGDDSANSLDCSDGIGGLDVAFLWTAPTSGFYQFDTNGSTFDTVLALRNFDECIELTCDDDGGQGNNSYLIYEVYAGQTIAIIVDGFESGDDGSFNLNIQPVAPPECADGVDNDSDTLIDFPNDPECESRVDEDEADTQLLEIEAPKNAPVEE